MNVRDTLTELYNSKQLNDCIDKFVKPDYRDDFRQELFLILLTKPEPELRSIIEQGNIIYYVVRIIINLSRQDKNTFQLTYFDKKIDYDTEKVLYSRSPADFDTIGERQNREDKEDAMLKELEGIDSKMGSNNFPYYEKIIKIIAEQGSLRKAAEITGIPKSTIHSSVKKVRGHFKDRLC
jgi:hypothetical protein